MHVHNLNQSGSRHHLPSLCFVHDRLDDYVTFMSYVVGCSASYLHMFAVTMTFWLMT